MMSLPGTTLLPYQLHAQQIRALQSHQFKYSIKPSITLGLTYSCELPPQSSAYYPSSRQWDVPTRLECSIDRAQTNAAYKSVNHFLHKWC
uniref:Uncharacterized protein n=1 Tax=Rhipicephalus zambeziensis TaxID=60191 RepID=A0A224Y5K1_9ACAR